ncbi:phospholipase C [Microbacterium mangrovi]|uniref:Phospholipase C n=1 Tax=Microbacterium mangrovi TaxID=1348253 RepID=A0A0B2A3A6_9MICO|nr:alkaline phosphatase family protein [Microbacterium mangrovi]KHK96077.1 phospholipase C [Microbacterium mangrovi]
MRRAGIVVAAIVAAGVGLAACTGAPPHPAASPHTQSAIPPPATASASPATATPITHVVVIFDENVSYDHYFGTYPAAANTDGTRFTASTGTPASDDLVSSGALAHNPNLSPPRRLSPAQALTCDQDHGYTAEQRAVNGGRMDRFVQNTSGPACANGYSAPGLVMDYFDGNTVTALWNYAQHYAMSDNAWDAVFGPSTPGALDLVSGQTHGVTALDPGTHRPIDDPAVIATDAGKTGTLTADLDPAFDDCSAPGSPVARAAGANIGTLLNAKGVTWGWFQGGFRPTVPAGAGSRAVCGAAHPNLGGASVPDYSAHHEPFQYSAATANPHHLAPTSVAMIGRTDRANHQYDLSDFTAALNAGDLPAVSFLKPARFQDGHAGYSDPIDEQHFLVSEINALQRSPLWASTAVIVAYDDSDGWYDHAPPAITNASHTASDAAVCTGSAASVLGGYAGRCGPSQRLPLLVISPYARSDFIAHDVVSQASVLKFIEDDFGTGRIGDGSFDATAGSLTPLFDFAHPDGARVLLKPDGSVASITR